MKKLLSCFLVLLALLMLPGPAVEADAATIVDSGTCGENVTWALDSDGLLTISGTGDMEQYSEESGFEAPWYEQRMDIQSAVIEDGVTTLASSAFSGCSNLKNVMIPDNVTEIGDHAFYNCSSLESVTIPDSITEIGYSAFSGCNSLTDVYITDLAAWLRISFNYNANPLCAKYSVGKLYLDGELLTDLVIPDGVTEIGEYAFQGCSSLESVTIPDSVTEIGSAAFHNCSSLESVTIPDSVTEIGSVAFYNCSSLESVTIPESVTEIGSAAFENCSSLERVTIGDGVAKIGHSAFEGCSSLESVTIPDSVTTIGYYAFRGCYSLTDVYITDIAAWLNIIFVGSDANPLRISSSEKKLYLKGELLTDLVIPDGVTEIGEYAFCNCSSLASVTIPDSVTEIGYEAFCNCSSLESVTIPDSVTKIGDYAFSGCSDLKDVYYAGSAAEWNDIDIEKGNDPLFNAKIHYDVTEVPPEETEPEATEPKETEPKETEPEVTGPQEEPPKDDKEPVAPEETKPMENPFTDVAEDAYYFAPVLWAVEKGITNGLSADTFGPDATCTRGQIVTFLWRAKGSPEPQMVFNPFSDVSSSDYFYKAVLWAVEKGITSGMGDGTFAPGAPCTRGQVATFLWRSQGQPSVNGENIFTDIAPGAYYYDAVLWAVENSITNGMGDGTFAPDAPCTRGQIVTFLYRAMAN